MADTQLQLASEQFSSLLKMRLQQMQSLVRGKIAEGTHVGKLASPVQYMNPFAMETPAGPFSPLNLSQPSYSRRWLNPSPFEKAMPIDSFDALLTMIDPQSQMVMGMTAAMGRAWDDSIMAAAFGTAQTGTDIAVLSSETWAQAQNGLTGSNTGLTVAVTFEDGATSTGLTIAKLREVRRLFRHYHALDNPGEPIYLIAGSTQESNLLAQTQVASQEYNPSRDGVPVLKNGQIDSFLGINFIWSERVPYSSTTRQCIAFVKDGLYLGVWMDIQSNADYRVDLSGRPLQLSTRAMYGATRLEPGRIIEVDCYDTVGADNI